MNEKRKEHYSYYLDSIVKTVISEGLFDKVKEHIGDNMYHQGIVFETLYQLKLQKYYEFAIFLDYKLKTGKDIEFFDKNTIEEIKRIYGIFVDNFYNIYGMSFSNNFYITCKILEKMGISNKYFNIKHVMQEKRAVLDKKWDKVMN